MSKDIAKLVVKLEAQTKKYDDKLAKANKTIKRFHTQQRKSLKGIAGDFKTILGGVAIGLFTRKIISATKEQEQAVAQLEQGLATTGNAVGYSLSELTKKAEELQKVTTFGDEGIIQAMSQLVTFTGITKEQFDRTTVAVLDLATRMDGDLKGSVVQLGKALNDPVANLSALSRSGIQFNTTQKAMIKDLVESNKLMEAQDIILTELEKQFGGSAAAARDTFGGALDGLSGAFNDLFEATSGLDGAKDSVEDLVDMLQDDDIKSGINALISGFVKLAALSLEFVSNVDDVIGRIMGVGEEATTTAAALEALSQIQIDPSSFMVFKPGPKGTKIATQIATDFQAEIDKNTGMLVALAVDMDTAGLEKTISEVVELTEKAARDMVAGIDVEKNKALIEGLISTSEILKGQIELLSDRNALLSPAGEAGGGSQAGSGFDLVISPEKVNLYDEHMKKLADTITLANVPAAKFERELEKLNAVFYSGHLSAEAYDAALLQLKAELEGLPDTTKEVGGEMDIFAEEAARNMQDAFADFLFDPFADGLDGMLKGFLKIIQRMAAEQLAANIFGSLPGLFGGSTPGGAPIVDALPTMNGGGFTGTGGRFGGVDGLGGFMAVLHPNETVIDHTLQGSAKGSNQITIAPQFSLSAIDSRSMAEVLQEQQGVLVSLIDQHLNEKGVSAL
tara:strand:- start:1364 stop:3397 length:2034 start_codon:yes stop_codon:yes gene_type:complete